MLKSDSETFTPPTGPAYELLYLSKMNKISALQVVDAWYQQVDKVDSFDPFKCSTPGACDDFTALIWDKMDSIGCGCVKTTGNDFAYICRLKSGDIKDTNFVNSMKPSN